MNTKNNIVVSFAARKSVFHPNAQDMAVFDAMIQYKDQNVKLDQLVKLTNFSKEDISKSIKFLSAINKVVINGKGRGTFYTTNESQNDLSSDATFDQNQFRSLDAPSVKSVVRAVFNVIPSLEKVKSSQVIAMALHLFPQANLQKSSFGQVFSALAKDGEIQFDPEVSGRQRLYWRNADKLENAAEMETEFDFLQFSKSEDDQQVVA